LEGRKDLTTTQKAVQVTSTAAGAGVGAAGGAAYGAMAGAMTGPAAPIMVPLLSLIGAGIGAWGGGEFGDWFGETMSNVMEDPATKKKITNEAAKKIQQSEGMDTDVAGAPPGASRYQRRAGKREETDKELVTTLKQLRDHLKITQSQGEESTRVLTNATVAIEDTTRINNMRGRGKN